MTDAVRDPRINDLIGFAVDSKPLDFTNTFNDIVKDRIVAAVDARKSEVAKAIFTPPEAEAEPQEEEDTDGS